MTNIHASAIVSTKAKIAKDVKIGPYCVIGDQVTLESGVNLISHVCVEGITTIGENTVIYPFASIGHQPQDKKFSGENSRLIIGKNNSIREYVTMQSGTAGDRMETKVGNDCLFMAGSHVAHDCLVGNNVIMANNATLGGHVEVGDYVIIGGLSAVHQFVRIGSHAIIGGMSGLAADLIPFGNAFAKRANLEGLNLIGLKRRAFKSETIHNLRQAYSDLFECDDKTFEVRLQELESKYHSDEAVMEIISFLKNDSSRSICLPRNKKVI